MAALPYIQLVIPEYIADTMHLSTEEHGAYLLLLFNYWQTGKPIPTKRLQAITRLPNDRWTVVERSLNELFIVDDENGVWKHKRIEKDLAEIRRKQKQRQEAGKASAEARARKAADLEEDSNGRSTGVGTDDEQPMNEYNNNNSNSNSNSNSNKTLIPAKAGIVKTAVSTPDPVPFLKILDLYHEKLPELPQVHKLTEARKRHIRARWKQDLVDLEDWGIYFDRIRQSEFLMGNGRPSNGRKPFLASLDFIITEANMTKILEGYYHG